MQETPITKEKDMPKAKRDSEGIPSLSMTKRVVTVVIEGSAPLSQGAAFKSERLTNEPHADYDARCWREHLHVDKDGNVFIPATAMKNCLSEIAKYLSKPVPGKGKATFTKHFEAGVVVADDAVVHDTGNKPVKADAVEGEDVYVPSDGQRGGSSRVWKRFPKIPTGWRAMFTILLLDDTINQAVFEEHIGYAGRYIGLGRFRPRNNGMYGRFEVKEIKW